MPLFDLFFAMLWFFLWIAWIWLVISIFIDIFRSDDLSGWGKAGWSILILFVPFLGVLIYLIVRGGSMQERAMRDAAEAQRAQQDYIRSVAGGGGGASAADEIDKLSRLKDSGAITQAEFDAQKAKLLA